MQFEHLIEINDPLMTLLDPLSREEIWQGLVLRAYAPKEFVLGLEGADVEELSGNGGITVLSRTLDYGRFTVRDTVTLYPLQSTVTDVSAAAGIAKSRLTITIEEPATDRFYLRFLYESEDEEIHDGMDAMTMTLRKEAYYASDIDTVTRIRTLAEQRRMQ